MKQITFIIFALFLFLKTEAQVFQEWAQRYNGPDSLSDAANAIDADGNIYVAGYSYNVTTGNDYIVLKYSVAGELLWSRTYNGTASENDQAVAIVVDASGNAYVLGNSAGSGSGQDLVTIKYDGNGNELWAARFDYNNSFQMGSAVALDASGNVFITGSNEDDYITVKYNNSGMEQWVRFYDGPANLIDRANALAVDAAGNAYVTGFSAGIGTKWDFATVKYNSTGDELWVARHNDGVDSNDVAHAIALDKNGNVYVTGANFTLFENGHDFATVKYNSSGIEQWVSHYNGTGNGSDIATSVAVDNNANVYVTGFSMGAGSVDYATVKYNTNGILKWAQRYDGPGNGIDVAFALALDKNSNVYVTGASIGGESGLDYTTIKYASAGQFEWVQRYNGTANGADRANAIAVDTTGNVFVTGVSNGTGTGLDIATVKYRQVSSDQILALINNNISELKENLNLVARSIVGLMNDDYFKTLVATETSQNYWVTFNALIEKSNNQNIDLKQLILNSASSSGLSALEIQKVSEIINYFKVGDVITFFPQIVFPAMNPNYFDKNGWDGKTPCYTAVSLFYKPAAKIPAYNTDNIHFINSNLSEIEKLKHLKFSAVELFKRPVWYISFAHNIDVLMWNGKFLGKKCPLYIRMDQTVLGSCDCVCNPDYTGACTYECLNGPGGNPGCPEDSDGGCSPDCSDAIIIRMLNNDCKIK